jgi:hypothetical protein
MTRTQTLCSVALAALIAGLPRLSFSQGEKLRHDPFARPALAKLQQAARLAPKGNGKQSAAEPKRALNLQAVMVAGANSMVNVDGIMVRIGDQIHGYRLVAVHARTAIFEKDKAQFTVSMRSNLPAAREGQ